MNSTFRRTALSAAVLAGLGLAGAAHALEAKLSGQVNRSLMRVDNGQDSKTFFTDNDNSSTRFRFTGSDDIGNGLKLGVIWEMEFQSNPSNTVSFTSASASPSLDERHGAAFLQSNFGKITLGQTDGAGNGAVEVDLSGTSVINFAGTRFIGGGIAFVPKTAGGPTNVTINGTTQEQDFESRYDLLRYDTPSLGPVVLSVSSGTTGAGNDADELAARLDLNLAGGGKVAAALAHSVEKFATATGDEKTTGGSISFLASSGLNLTTGYTTKKDNNPANPDSDFRYFKIGYKSGMHAVSLDHAIADDQAAQGDKAKMFGVGYVFTPVKWAELYAGAKVHSLDRTGVDFEDITIVTLGTRVKF